VMMGLTHLLGISQALLCLLDVEGATNVTVGLSSSCHRGRGPRPERIASGLSCGCLLAMRVDPHVSYVAPASPIYFPKLKRLFA
jgi:hypothetical protein